MAQDTPPNGQVIVEKIGSVLRLTLDNPTKKNAITREMYLQMVEALGDSATDSDVRAVWLRGSGGVFSSGNDVGGFNAPKGEVPAPAQFVRALVEYPKPIVAEVEGLAVGIGVTLLLHCDIIYAAEGTKFRMPFVNLGVVPEAGSSYLLPRLMGAARAAELILLGRDFDAAEAQELGLISRALPAAEVAAAAEAAATALSKQPPQAMRASRALLRNVSGDALGARINEEFELFFKGVQGPEFAEAVQAFMQKREPDFSRFS